MPWEWEGPFQVVLHLPFARPAPAVPRTVSPRFCGNLPLLQPFPSAHGLNDASERKVKGACGGTSLPVRSSHTVS